ncbi:hypothetical protein L6452_28141 [Arctium lappa]|uniref:Uncharacterized protein n=1 Tax=Arctium lappa TaxID=4217 RepID=A0ACB8ZXN2_ARCLA|nr:hypothetical protein L6452_28141 [Arctium lappa]
MVVVSILDLIAFGLAVAAEQRRSTMTPEKEMLILLRLRFFEVASTALIRAFQLHITAAFRFDANGDFKQLEKSISELVHFLDSISDLIAEDEQGANNSAFEFLSEIYWYLFSHTLDEGDRKIRVGESLAMASYMSMGEAHRRITEYLNRFADVVAYQDGTSLKHLLYQPPLPADQVKVATEFEYEGDGSPTGRGRGHGGRGRGRSREPFLEMVLHQESMMMGGGTHLVITQGAGAITIMVLMWMICMMEDIIKKHPCKGEVAPHMKILLCAFCCLIIDGCAFLCPILQNFLLHLSKSRSVNGHQLLSDLDMVQLFSENCLIINSSIHNNLMVGGSWMYTRSMEYTFRFKPGFALVFWT